jgi:hypothetical protein
MTSKEIKIYVKLGQKNGIEREEIYDSRCPAHWPHDRCLSPEGDAAYAERIKTKLKGKGKL